MAHEWGEHTNLQVPQLVGLTGRADRPAKSSDLPQGLAIGVQDPVLQRREGRLGETLELAQDRCRSLFVLSCCRFRGRRDKVFMKLEDSDDEEELQPRV